MLQISLKDKSLLAVCAAEHGKSTANLNTIAHIALLAIATAAFVTRHPNLARSRKLCSRSA